MSPAGKPEDTDGSSEGKTDKTSVLMSDTAGDASAEQADASVAHMAAHTEADERAHTEADERAHTEADGEAGREADGEQSSSGRSAKVVDPDEVEASAAVPPWQRVTSEVRRPESESPYSPPSSGQLPTDGKFDYRNYGSSATVGSTGARVLYADQEQTMTNLQPAMSAPTENFLGGVEPEPPQHGRTTMHFGTGPGSRQPGGGTPSALRRPGRGPRRASLQVKRVDPWSVLKLALVLSIALFFVWLVAVGVLYGVLDGMGVWDKLNGTYSDLVQPGSGSDNAPLISAGRVFGIAAIVGGINIVLITALSTVGAFIYNVSADLAGGLEITLAERE